MTIFPGVTGIIFKGFLPMTIFLGVTGNVFLLMTIFNEVTGIVFKGLFNTGSDIEF